MKTSTTDHREHRVLSPEHAHPMLVFIRNGHYEHEHKSVGDSSPRASRSAPRQKKYKPESITTAVSMAGLHEY